MSGEAKMKADKGQQGDKGHSTSLRSEQGNHTPGPWRVSTHDGYTVVVGRGLGEASIADCYDWMESTKEANARRIVACVNYCEGVSTAELEAAPKSVNLRAILDALDSAANTEEIVAILAKAKP